MKKPFFSLIIPTKRSSKYLGICLGSIKKQKGVDYEIIIADNQSDDDTVHKALSLGAKVINVHGKAPQVCNQRNQGALQSSGRYIIFLDHDMELPLGFLLSLKKQVIANPNIDALYIPEKMKASSKLLSDMRTFENSCYENTPIVAARVIKRESYRRTKGYDPILSGGPADWDFDLVMHKMNFKFATTKKNLIHHEESLSYWNYVKKKKQYHAGIKLYKEKWRKFDKDIYNKFVTKQFSVLYRLVFVFVEDNKWKKTLKNFHLYLFFLMTRFFMFWHY